jgi:dihydrofolate reductase
MIGDAFFPKFDKSKWLEVSREDALSSNNISFSFIDYKKIT